MMPDVRWREISEGFILEKRSPTLQIDEEGPYLSGSGTNGPYINLSMENSAWEPVLDVDGFVPVFPKKTELVKKILLVETD